MTDNPTGPPSPMGGIERLAMAYPPARIDVYLDRVKQTGRLAIVWHDESFFITDFGSARKLERYMSRCRWIGDAVVTQHLKESP